MNDEQILDVIKSVCGFDSAGVERWRAEALIIGRAVEQASRRAALEEAKQLCLAREARVEPVTKGDCEWFTGFSDGIKTGARHCACEIDDAICSLAAIDSNGGA